MWTVVKDAIELLNTTFSTTYENKEHFEENKKNLPLVLEFWLFVNWTNEFQNFKQGLQTKSSQINCRNPTLAKCEDETHSQSWGFGVLRDSRMFRVRHQGKKTSPWGVLGVIGKVLKCRCPKWPRIGHLDIYNPSYGQKKGVKLPIWLPATKSRESTCSRRALGECDTTLKSSRRGLQVWFRPRPDWRSGREAMMSQNPRSPKPGQFRDFTLGVPGQTTTWVWARRSNAENTIGRMVVTPPESGSWCVMWVRVSPSLIPTPNACKMNSNQLVLVLDAGSWPNSLIFS